MANEKIMKAVEKKKFPQLKRMAEGKDAAVRVEAVEGMGLMGGEDSFNYLTGTLRSPEAAMRGAAATGLGTLKDPKGRAFLEHQLAAEQDEAVKQKMHDALSSIRSGR